MSNFSSLSILVIDDSKLITQQVKSIVTSFGIKNIYTANQPEKGLSLLQQNQIDLLLCDWNMPNMNGIELIRTLRSDPQYHDILIMMLTSENQIKKVQEAIAHGISGYITKPFSANDLIGNIKRTVQKHHAHKIPSLGNKTVLVVDDSDLVLKQMDLMLKEMGVGKVLTAKKGSEAQAAFKQGCPANIVYCDWHMPELSGLEMLKWIKSKSAIKHVPFVMITAESQSDAIQQALEHGVDEYLIKPIDPKELQSKTLRLLKKYQSL